MLALFTFNLWRNWPITGFYYELGILILLGIFVGLIYNRYLQKGKPFLTRLLFIIFLFYWFAVLASWTVKILESFYWDLNNAIAPNQQPVLKNENLLLFFLVRFISDFRVSLIFVTIAIYFSFIFKIKVFNDEPKPIHLWIIRGWGILIIAFCFIFWEAVQPWENPIAFLLTLIYMIVVYSMFLHKARQVVHKTQDLRAKSAFKSLELMSIEFMGIFIFLLVDQILGNIDNTVFGYTIFYFLAWAMAIGAVFSAYFGYINPRGKKVITTTN